MSAKLMHSSIQHFFRLIEDGESVSSAASDGSYLCSNVRSLVYAIEQELLTRGIQALEIFKLAHEHVNWIGGSLFQKDIFRFVYLGLNGLKILWESKRNILTGKTYRIIHEKEWESSAIYLCNC